MSPSLVAVLLTASSLLWRVTDAYSCTSSTKVGFTNYGPTLMGTDTAYPFSDNAWGGIVAFDGPHCLSMCCNDKRCSIAVFDNVQALCYLKTAQAVSSPYIASSNQVSYRITGRLGSSSSVVPFKPKCSEKRGVAYDFRYATEFHSVARSVKWFYNWTPGQAKPAMLTAAAKANIDFYPMIWSDKDLFAESWRLANVKKSKIVMGFNEPNFMSQANMTPERAAQLWPRIVAIADKAGAKIASPAVNYCGSNCIETDPIAWLDKFFAACGAGCRVDYIAFHSYVCEVVYLNQAVHRYAKYGKPLMLTEWSCLDVPGQGTTQQQAYMKDALHYLEMHPKVYKYAWFSGRTATNPQTNLFGESGGPTALASVYNKTMTACK